MITAASFIIVGLLVAAVLGLKLVAAAFAGFAIYILAHRLAVLLTLRVTRAPSRRRNAIALSIVLALAIALLVALCLAVMHFVNGPENVAELLSRIAETLEKARQKLPESMQAEIPATVEELRDRSVEMLKTHAKALSTVGTDTLRTIAHVIVGLAVGAITAWSTFGEARDYRPLSCALLVRLARLRESFEKVVFAQVRISAINTVLTSIYLLAVLPLLGIHLPLVKTLIGVTFVAGLLPVVGNLISNTAIVVLSLGISLEVGVLSLLFLTVIHKLEYFLNARIIGQNVETSAWELLLAMLGMEAIFGLGGLVAAPILYAYVKRELREAQLIGVKT